MNFKANLNYTGISSIQNLLNGTFIRVTVWIIATITVIGNVLVFSTRWKKNKESQILDIFIKNLAGEASVVILNYDLEAVNSEVDVFLAADLLMGVYLGIIAIKDLQYRGFFNTYAYSWSNSWECIMIGATAMISSEVKSDSKISNLKNCLQCCILTTGIHFGTDSYVIGKVLGN